MQELWLELQEKYRSGNIKKKEEQLYKKWGKALKLLSADPGYPSLQTHEIEPLSRRYGMFHFRICRIKLNMEQNYEQLVYEK